LGVQAVLVVIGAELLLGFRNRVEAPGDVYVLEHSKSFHMQCASVGEHWNKPPAFSRTWGRRRSPASTSNV
jgi:hypothetical protein